MWHLCHICFDLVRKMREKNCEKNLSVWCCFSGKEKLSICVTACQCDKIIWEACSPKLSAVFIMLQCLLFCYCEHCVLDALLLTTALTTRCVIWREEPGINEWHIALHHLSSSDAAAQTHTHTLKVASTAWLSVASQRQFACQSKLIRCGESVIVVCFHLGVFAFRMISLCQSLMRCGQRNKAGPCARPQCSS